MATAAAQIDRALLDFWGRVPAEYEGTTDEREAMIRLVTIWRRYDARTIAIQSLLEDLRRMERANRDSLEAMPPPIPTLPRSRPDRWPRASTRRCRSMSRPATAKSASAASGWRLPSTTPRPPPPG